jgi:hypothetical protein
VRRRHLFQIPDAVAGKDFGKSQNKTSNKQGPIISKYKLPYAGHVYYAFKALLSSRDYKITNSCQCRLDQPAAGETSVILAAAEGNCKPNCAQEMRESFPFVGVVEAVRHPHPPPYTGTRSLI